MSCCTDQLTDSSLFRKINQNVSIVTEALHQLLFVKGLQLWGIRNWSKWNLIRFNEYLILKNILINLTHFWFINSIMSDNKPNVTTIALAWLKVLVSLQYDNTYTWQYVYEPMADWWSQIYLHNALKKLNPSIIWIS